MEIWGEIRRNARYTLVGGTVSERPKVQLSKSCVGESPPWVQIPPVPPCEVAGHRNTPNPRFRGFSLLLGLVILCGVDG